LIYSVKTFILVVVILQKNVIFTNRFISEEEKLKYLQESKIYVQASAHEGFGIAVAEAMACECIPIGSMYTSLWEVIGDAGYLIKYGDLEQLITAISLAIDNPFLGKSARERIIKNFSRKSINRSEKLFQIINSLIKE